MIQYDKNSINLGWERERDRETDRQRERETERESLKCALHNNYTDNDGPDQPAHLQSDQDLRQCAVITAEYIHEQAFITIRIWC